MRYSHLTVKDLYKGITWTSKSRNSTSLLEITSLGNDTLVVLQG